MAATSAALCTVTVSKDVLETDLVLKLILNMVSTHTHQLSLSTISKPKQTLSMDLLDDARHPLTQRNTILRSLVGVALHGAADIATMQFGGGCAWSGGLLHAATSRHANLGPCQAASNLGNLVHWMSVADRLRNNNDNNIVSASIVSELEALLTHQAFVLPYAATATLADLDVCVALLSKNTDTDNYGPSLTRWMHQMVAVLKRLSVDTKTDLSALLPSLPSQTVPLPNLLLFDGTEHVDQVLSALYNNNNNNKTSNKASSDNNNNKKKQAAGKKQQPQNAAQKKGPPATKKKTKAAPSETPLTYDVTALDIRVGKIVKVWEHSSAEKLYCEEIDFGNGDIRSIASGLRPYYQSAAVLQDALVLVLYNLKKRNLVGFASHGMVLCASNADHTAVELIVPPQGSVLGERVVFEGLSVDAPPEPENKMQKKKIFEMVAPDLKTNEEGVVVWKSHVAKTSAGSVQAVHKMPHASVS